MTKKYFGTDGIRGAINSKNINGDMFFKFGLASGTYFKSQKKKKQTQKERTKGGNKKKKQKYTITHSHIADLHIFTCIHSPGSGRMPRASTRQSSSSLRCE